MKHKFESKYTYFNDKDRFIAFTESKRKNAKKHKGWILAVQFSNEENNPLILYTIQSSDYVGVIFESISEDLIIGSTEIEE